PLLDRGAGESHQDPMNLLRIDVLPGCLDNFFGRVPHPVKSTEPSDRPCTVHNLIRILSGTLLDREGRRDGCDLLSRIGPDVGPFCLQDVVESPLADSGLLRKISEGVASL